MSSAYVDLLLYAIKSSFGEDCQEICRVLLYNEWSTIKEIKKSLKNIKSTQIDYDIQLLIHFNLVQFNIENGCIDTLQFDIEAGISYLRYNLYIQIIDNEFGHMSKQIFMEFCRSGNQFTMDLFRKLMQVDTKDDNLLSKLIKTTNEMIKLNILEVSPLHLLESKSQNSKSLITFDEKLEAAMLSQPLKVGSKRTLERKTDTSWDIQYRINHRQMNILCRNDIILQDIALSCNEDAALVMKQLLSLFDFTRTDGVFDPVSRSLLAKRIKSTFNTFDDDKFDNCIYLLSTNPDVSYIEEIDNINGTLLRLDPIKIVEDLSIKMLAKVIEVCFGVNGKRIFNFLLKNHHIEENAFRNALLLPPTQINALLPAMLIRGFISKLELSKTKAYNDEPLVSLLHVDVDRVARNERESCYQCLYRLMVRRDHDKLKQETLLVKMDDMSCKDQNQQSIDEEGIIAAITDLDIQSMNQFKRNMERYCAAKLSIDRTLILLDEFINQRIKTANF